jgi:hypothetical protein
MLEERKNKEAVQQELERISRRKDFKIVSVVWQGAWR